MWITKDTRDTGALRRQPPIIPAQDTLWLRTPVCLEKRVAALRSLVESETPPTTLPKPPQGGTATAASGSGEGRRGEDTREGGLDGSNSDWGARIVMIRWEE